MSDEKVVPLPPLEQAADVSLYYHDLSNPRVAAALVEDDRRAVASAARAEGEAAGYARAVEEVAKWVSTRAPLMLEPDAMANAIRAKFGGK